jgi:hypothetical protein
VRGRCGDPNLVHAPAAQIGVSNADPALADDLKRAMERSGLSPAAFAKDAEVPESQVQRVLAGKAINYRDRRRPARAGASMSNSYGRGCRTRGHYANRWGTTRACRHRSETSSRSPAGISAPAASAMSCGPTSGSLATRLGWWRLCVTWTSNED